MEDNKFVKRKEIRLKEYDYSTDGAYFVTVCTKDRKHLFWDKEKMRSVVIGQMKRYASKTAGFGIWQKSFYDHIIRNYRDYIEKQNYILINPVKWHDDEYYI